MSAQEAARQYEECRQLHAEGRYQEALDRLDPLVKKYPDKPQLLLLEAMCLGDLGRIAEAVDLCDKIIALSNHPQAEKLKRKLQQPTISALPSLPPLVSQASGITASQTGVSPTATGGGRSGADVSDAPVGAHPASEGTPHIPGLAPPIDLGLDKPEVNRPKSLPQEPVWRKWLVWSAIGLGVVNVALLLLFPLLAPPAHRDTPQGTALSVQEGIPPVPEASATDETARGTRSREGDGVGDVMRVTALVIVFIGTMAVMCFVIALINSIPLYIVVALSDKLPYGNPLKDMLHAMGVNFAAGLICLPGLAIQIGCFSMLLPTLQTAAMRPDGGDAPAFMFLIMILLVGGLLGGLFFYILAMRLIKKAYDLSVIQVVILILINTVLGLVLLTLVGINPFSLQTGM